MAWIADTTAGQEPARAYPAQMAAAEKSLQLDDPRELRRWLDVTRPAERGWEWTYLNSVADTTERSLATGDAPIRIALSPRGDVVATVEGSVVQLRSWPSLEPVRTIEGHGDAVYRAEFSPDGTRLITVSRDVTSRTWDVASGREIARMSLANPAFAAATFSPDGATAATCAWERDAAGQVYGLVWLWNAATGEVRCKQRVGVKPLSAIRYTPDGSRLLVGSWGGMVHVLDDNAQEITRLTMPDDGVYNAVNDIAIHPGGDLVAAASKDRTTRLFSLSSGEVVATLRGHGGYVEGVMFSHDGARLATTSVDTSVRLWSTTDWSQTAVLRGAADTLRGAVWSPDDSRLVACSLDKRLLVWRTDRDLNNIVNINTGATGAYSAAFSPDGKSIAVSCYDGFLRMYDARSGELTDSWEAHPGSTCHAASFSADGRRLATASWDKTVRIWRVGSHDNPIILDAGNGMYACALSPDDARAALSGAALEIWDVNSAALLHKIAIEGTEPTRVEFSHDGALIASGWTDGQARVHDAAAGELVATLGRTGSRVETVAFTDDDARLITGDTAGVVRLFPARGGEAIIKCDTGGRAVNHVDVFGNRIAIACDQLWIMDLDHGDLVLGLKPHTDTIWHLSWSHDGRRVATCSGGFIAVLGEREP